MEKHHVVILTKVVMYLAMVNGRMKGTSVVVKIQGPLALLDVLLDVIIVQLYHLVLHRRPNVDKCLSRWSKRVVVVMNEFKILTPLQT